jgi:hypothetical protein
MSGTGSRLSRYHRMSLYLDNTNICTVNQISCDSSRISETFENLYIMGYRGVLSLLFHYMTGICQTGNSLGEALSVVIHHRNTPLVC